MLKQKYSVNQYQISAILELIKTGEVAIPEIQRPFVWDATNVRDLMDSLYQGYPIGYLIAWRNPDVKLKDGSVSAGKRILIDGQQRVTALRAAILGEQVVNKEYENVTIKIAFQPAEQKFEVFNTAIAKDNAWIPDISPIVTHPVGMLGTMRDYCTKNPAQDEDKIYEALSKLQQITTTQIGFIELASDLDIETVTEIFIRINSKGVVLSQADFAMSKIAASEENYGYPHLRKCIDYFCHIAVKPEFYGQIAEKDKKFAATSYYQKMAWLKGENDDLYDPGYNDMLRVAFTSEFERGRLADLVSLLSGRNFETRTFEEQIARESFGKLEKGILNFINQTNFQRFLMIIRSAGFISSRLIRSQNALNFAYIVYLKLRASGYNAGKIESYVCRWFVMSLLTSRYSGAADSQFDFDIKNVASKDFADYLSNVEQAALSDAFWNVALVESLNTSVASSPNFGIFLAAQVKMGNKGFLSKDITVGDLIAFQGDIHHVFPRHYLKKNELSRGQYNQIANYAFMQSEINIKIGNKAPNVYFDELRSQCNGGGLKYGSITDEETLRANLKAHCIPTNIFEMDITHYDEFLRQRRVLMAQKLKEYYFSL